MDYFDPRLEKESTQIDWVLIEKEAFDHVLNAYDSCKSIEQFRSAANLHALFIQQFGQNDELSRAKLEVQEKAFVANFLETDFI
jgi:hypothetical protein